MNIHTLQWSYLLSTKTGSGHVLQYKGRCITTPNIHQISKNINGCLPLQKKPATLGRSENTLHNCCVGPSHPWSAGKLRREKEMMQKSAALRTYHTCFSYTYKRACYKDVHWDKQTQKKYQHSVSAEPHTWECIQCPMIISRKDLTFIVICRHANLQMKYTHQLGKLSDVSYNIDWLVHERWYHHLNAERQLFTIKYFAYSGIQN